MTLKEKLSAEPGFRYIIDNMELMSAPGRRRMLQQPFLTDAAELGREYDNTQKVMALLEREECRREVATIRHQLMQIHDLQGTLVNLRQGTVLEEIELFEIKNFCFLCRETLRAATALGIDHLLALPQTDHLFRMLDPDGTNIPNFYIYDSYHPDLPEVRRQLKAKQTLLDGSDDPASDDCRRLQREIGDLFEQQNAIQQQVIASLSQQLREHCSLLQEAYDGMAYTDFLFAKATLAFQWGLCRPGLSDGEETRLVQLWNPRLRHRNESMNLRYQPVDLTLSEGVCLVTGANMAGKTVLLKTVGIAQLLAQTGLFVPAKKAVMRLVDDVVLCIGDEQNEMNGLSSFASEIIKISDTVERSTSERLLILVDEPARTTNPVEGKAIVQSVATLLNESHSTTLITTHYSQLGLPCRRLRVKGFVESQEEIPLSPDNINRFMDYSLLEDDRDEVPQEALRIAAILKCDERLLQTAERFLTVNG